MMYTADVFPGTAPRSVTVPQMPTNPPLGQVARGGAGALAVLRQNGSERLAPVFERLRDALRAGLDAATPPGDLRDLTRQMREAVVEAKVAVVETGEAVARTERELAQERQ